MQYRAISKIFDWKNLMFKIARFTLVPAGALLVMASANAAVPAAVTTAITEMATDGAVIAGAVLVALIGIIAIKFLRKAF